MRTFKLTLAFVFGIILAPLAQSNSNLQSSSSSIEMSMTDNGSQSSTVSSSEEFETSPSAQESKSSAPSKRWKDRKVIGKVLIITGIVIIVALAAVTGGISVY